MHAKQRQDRPAAQDAAEIAATVADSLASAVRSDAPFTHWRLSGLFPAGTVGALVALAVTGPDVSEESGKREMHNDQRSYFAGANLDRHPVMRAVAEAFQSPVVTAAIVALTGARLAGTSLRIEYCVDTNGFWLEPHTDVGVKTFTMLCQLASGPEQRGLGTDLYADPQARSVRVAFESNHALVFVPSSRTWHGFARRPIRGERRSVIVNYVDTAWRAREQLAFPGDAIGI